MIADCKRRVSQAHPEKEYPYPKNLPETRSDCLEDKRKRWVFLPGFRVDTPGMFGLENMGDCNEYVDRPDKFMRDLTDDSPFEPMGLMDCDHYTKIRRMKIKLLEDRTYVFISMS